MASEAKPPNVFLRKGRWYWEPPAKLRATLDVKPRPLGADQAEAWNAARFLNQDLAKLRQGEAMPGTIQWVFDQFFKTEKFQALAHGTKADYRWIGRLIAGVQFGAHPANNLNARSLKARHADFIVEKITAKSGHAAAHYTVRVARRIWKWAIRKEFVEANPWIGMEMKSLPAREQLWTPAQIAAVISQAEEMGWPSVALAVRTAYGIGHRKGDVLTLTWTALDEGFRRTNKTKATLPVVQEAYPELDAALQAERARQKAAKIASTHVIINETTNCPWHPHTFTHAFRIIADAAGLPADLQFRDIRATVMTELNDGGASVLDLSTHGGHRDLSSKRRYVRPTKEGFQRAAAKREAARTRGTEQENPSEPPSELRNSPETGGK